MGATGRIDSLLICGGGSTSGSTDREKTAASASASISSTKRSRQLHATMRQCDMWHPSRSNYCAVYNDTFNRVFDRHVSFQQELLNIQGMLPRHAGALAGESRVCFGLKKQ